MTFDEQITQIKELGLMRELRAVEPAVGAYCTYKGQTMLNLTSNDYLGLANNQKLKKAFLQANDFTTEAISFGASSSRLLTGNTNLYDEVETLLAQSYGAEAALFFNSGYHANMGILPALTGKKDLILSDKLCHASLIDGIRLCQADHIRYRHMDHEQLKTILTRKRHLYNRIFIVTESVFSMDGDINNLQQLVDIKNQFDCMLYVDEAHAVGVSGSKGLGLCEEQNVIDQIDIIVGTLGKAYASIGAFAIVSKSLKQLLVNKVRTLIYTTALPPINMAWTKFIIENMTGFVTEREQLKALSDFMVDKLQVKGYMVHNSHIMPVMVGDNKVAVQLAEHLQKKGFLVFPIRPPTVPVNTARLRISLTADMKLTDLEKLIPFIPDYKNEY